MIFMIIFLFFLFFLLTIFIILYNDLIFLKNRIFQSLSNIDVLLKQRNDELTNLIEVVKGYASYEQETLAKVIKIRSGYSDDMEISEKSKFDNALSKETKKLFALAEKYPDLKANENFLNLQKRITTIENHIADRRESYNWCVTNFNTKIEQFPYNLISSILGFKKYPLFKK
ncbi:MAG: LemA family protein [candidate division WOR-3 bacterium]